MQNFSKESFGDNDYNPENYRQEHDSPDRKAQVFINQMDAKISANSTLNGTIKNEFKELLNNLKTSIRDFETEVSRCGVGNKKLNENCNVLICLSRYENTYFI